MVLILSYLILLNLLTCLVFVCRNRSRVPRDAYSCIAVLIFHKASQHCCDGPGIILFRRTMDEEKKILEAELLAPLQMVDIFIVIFSLIHQEGGGGSLFCPPFMSASAFQVRLKLHLSVNTLVSSFCPRCCANGITKRLIAEVTPDERSSSFRASDDSLFSFLFFFKTKGFFFFYSRFLIITSFGLEMEPYAIFLISRTGGAFSALPPLCSFFPGSVAKSCSAAKSHIQTKAAPGQLWVLFALGKKLSFLSNPGHTCAGCLRASIVGRFTSETEGVLPPPTLLPVCFSVVCGEAPMVSVGKIAAHRCNVNLMNGHRD